MKRKKWLQVTILLLLIIVGGYTMASGLFGDKDSIPLEGDQAPDFTLLDLNDETLRLSDFEDQVVMINFWGTFCEPCVYEMPLFQQNYEKHKDDGLVVLGVNLDEPVVSVRRFIRDYGITFPIPLDKNVVRRQYGVTQYPTTFFVNRNGEIEKIFVGAMEEWQLEPILQGLLASE